MLPPVRRAAAPSGPRVIVGCDPSVAAFGWSLLALEERHRVIAAGWIPTEASDDRYVFERDGKRIDDLAIALSSVLAHARTLGSVTVAYEVPSGSQSVQAARMMATSFTITRTAIVLLHLPAIPLFAGEVKRIITGDADAEKAIVADCVEKAIGWRSSASTKDQIEAESDAVAVALCGARRLRGIS